MGPDRSPAFWARRRLGSYRGLSDKFIRTPSNRAIACAMDIAALEKALADQQIVANDASAAKALAEKATRWSLAAGDVLFAPGRTKRSGVYFIISGGIMLLHGKRPLAILGDKECLGEFPLLDTKFLTNQVTAQAARNDTVVAVVTYEDFEDIACAHPLLWRRIARSLALRLDRMNRSEDLANELRRYDDIATGWRRLSTALSAVHYTMGSLALALAATVSAKVDIPGVSHDQLAWLAAIMTGLLAFLSPEGRAIRARQGWAVLNAALARARADPSAGIEDVIQAHRQGEAIISKIKDHETPPPRARRKPASP
jgi:CRP-like cAMP-binding protein